MIKRLAAAFALVLALASCGSLPDDSKPTQRPKPTIKDDGSTQKPAPTGCDGKILKREYDGDTPSGDHGTFTITYLSGECETSVVKTDKITFEQDLNARCDAGDYFRQCLTWWETEPPGIRMPSDPATGG